MVRGISHAKGIMFIGPSQISHSYEKGGVIHNIQEPKNLWTLCMNTGRMTMMLPVRHLLVLFGTGALAGFTYLSAGVPNIPFSIYVLILFSYHFWFPMEMRKYHAAEHQVFSSRQKDRHFQTEKVLTASAVNRNCSTNVILMYFLLFSLMLVSAAFFYRFIDAVSIAAYTAVPFTFILIKTVKRWRYSAPGKEFHQISAWLQKNVTTAPPEIRHVQLAVAAYGRLLEAEKKYKKKFQ